MWLHPDDVGRENLCGRDEARQAVRALDRLHLRPDRRADCDVVEDFAPHAIGDLGRALDEAPDLQVDATAELLDAEPGLHAILDDALEQRTHRPPERALCRVRLHVLDALDRVAHHTRGFFIAAQPAEETLLEDPPLLDQV